MNITYDTIIKQATEEYLPGVDWRLLKAQLYAESALEIRALSWAGAMGIAQFMPKTWDQVKEQMNLPRDASPYDPQMAIPACAFYMSKLYNSWTSPRPDADRYCLALASYNAGFGNILKAQKKAGGANDYFDISCCLHEVTGLDNSQETLNYVSRIFRTFINYITNGG